MRTFLPSLLLLALVAFPGCRDCTDCTTKEEGPPPVTAAWRGGGATIELSVWEMTCPGCSDQIETAIQAIDGVASVKADHKSAKVVVTLKDAATREKLIPAIREAVHGADKIVVGEDKPGA
jgi:copper chaperone CopZ